MEIKIIKIDNVKKADYNPRKISKDEKEKLKKSLKEFGCVKPLVINKLSGNLVSGHQTLDAAKDLGWEDLPYVEVSLPEKKEKALNVALNKLNEGGWDYDKLGVLLEEIKETDVFDCTGFDVTDIDLMEKLNDDGSIIEDSVADEYNSIQKKYQLTFEFDNENEMLKVKKVFMNKKYGWKAGDKVNSNLLKKIAFDKKGE